MILEKDKVDIILVTFHREEMLKQTLEGIKQRTRFPHRIILVDNGSKNELREEVDVYIKNNENVGFGKATNIGLDEVNTEYVITTCNDIIPPDLEGPCWLERLVTLIEQNQEYGGINCRCQFMPKYRFEDESKQLYPQKIMSQACFRIQRTQEMKSIGGIPYLTKGLAYESLGFAKGVYEKLNKKIGCAAHIHLNHIGWETADKGYPEGVDYEFKVRIKRKFEIDTKTNCLIGHTCPTWRM